MEMLDKCLAWYECQSVISTTDTFTVQSCILLGRPVGHAVDHAHHRALHMHSVIWECVVNFRVVNFVTANLTTKITKM